MSKNKLPPAAMSVLLVLSVFLVPDVLPANRVPAELRDAITKVESYKLHYRIGGSGPILVMLHGMTLTGEQWLPFAKDFTDSYTVVIADLPGHGGSSPQPNAFSFAKSAKLMHGLLDELGAERAYGIGHSAGGMILLHMAAQQPKRLKAMVLVDAPHYLGPEARKIAHEDTWGKLDPEVQEWYRTLHPGGQTQAENLFRQYNGFANSSEHVYPEVLKTLPVNTLIIWGDRDPAFPLETAMEMYRSLPNAALWVIPQQGHTPLWPDMGGDASAAATFARVAKEFLANEEVSKGKWF